MDNYQIAEQFELLGKLMDIHQENAFKAKSYGSAAFAIEKLPQQLSTTERSMISGLKGIGESTAKKIIEILDTGNMIVLEELISKTPEGILEMMQIKGLGPKKICTIWKDMGIESIGELLYACNENRLLLYKGFGEKTQKNVAESIEYFMKHKGHFLYAEIESFVMALNQLLNEKFALYKTVIGGGFARQIPTIEHLSWVTTIPKATLIDFLEGGGFSIVLDEKNHLQVKNEANIPITFICTEENEFAWESFKNRSSEEFNNKWTLEFGNSPIQSSNEEDIFRNVGLPFIPPYARESFDIISFYKNESLQIIQPNDIRGIIHSHSDWSDGINTIEEMVKGCISRRLEYLVISDHSKVAGYANGLNEERVKAQHIYIDELNAKYPGFRVFKSIECDILNDGSLDYSDDFLSTFDIVIASIHSNLKMNEDKAMQRLMAAIENPYTSILGHMTGRLLLSRKGYPVDHVKIIDACAANEVAIEINAHPRRLDIDWTWVRAAQEKGVLLSINPDAHAVNGFDDTRYGVLVAQKGLLKKENNLSSFNLESFEKFLVTQHSKRM